MSQSSRPAIDISAPAAEEAVDRLGRDLGRAVGRTFGSEAGWAIVVWDGAGVRWTASDDAEFAEAVRIIAPQLGSAPEE